MKNFTGLFVVGIIAIVLLFNVFAGGEGSRGVSGSYIEDTYNELPSEPSRSEIIDTIESSSANNIEQLVQEAFPLLDTVRTEQGISRIYITKELNLPEVANYLSAQIQPEEISSRQDRKQVLVYPDHFVILQESIDEPGLITIELANDEFVRRNYSPGFFQGMLAYSLLNRALGSSDWSSRRSAQCQQTGDCYSGYGMYGGYNGTSGTFRGSSTRGGGPGTGK
ncbi:DUF4247 domain-containing protein [Halobacillus fulvus]|nr:DUF4247 domain-containing protein [Halobacillus fulvus]